MILTFAFSAESLPNGFVWALAVVALALVLILMVLLRSGVLSRLAKLDWTQRLLGSFRLKFYESISKEDAILDERGISDRPKVSVGPTALRGVPASNLIEPAEFKTQLGSILEHYRAALPPAASTREQQMLAKAFELLKSGTKEDIVEAKKLFDNVTQCNPQSAEGNFGLARVLEIWKDPANASKYYWETVKADHSHPRAIQAKENLEGIAKRTRQQAALNAATKRGPGPSDFWHDQIPDVPTLARSIVALSNSEEGGTVILGLDKASRKPSGYGLDGWESVLHGVLFSYVTAPCNCEIYETRHCIFIAVQTGLCRPYRVIDGGRRVAYLVDCNGGVREANPEEIRELNRKKRG